MSTNPAATGWKPSLGLEKSQAERMIDGVGLLAVDHRDDELGPVGENQNLLLDPPPVLRIDGVIGTADLLDRRAIGSLPGSSSTFSGRRVLDHMANRGPVAPSDDKDDAGTARIQSIGLAPDTHGSPVLRNVLDHVENVGRRDRTVSSGRLSHEFETLAREVFQNGAQLGVVEQFVSGRILPEIGMGIQSVEFQVRDQILSRYVPGQGGLRCITFARRVAWPWAVAGHAASTARTNPRMTPRTHGVLGALSFRAPISTRPMADPFRRRFGMNGVPRAMTLSPIQAPRRVHKPSRRGTNPLSAHSNRRHRHCREGSGRHKRISIWRVYSARQNGRPSRC